MSSKTLRKNVEQAIATFKKTDSDYEGLLKQHERLTAKHGEAIAAAKAVDAEVDRAGFDEGSLSKLATRKAEAAANVSVIGRALSGLETQMATTRVQIAQAEYACFMSKRELFAAEYKEQLDEFIAANRERLYALWVAAHWMSVYAAMPQHHHETALMYRIVPDRLADRHIADAVKELAKNDSRFEFDENKLIQSVPVAAVNLSKHITTEQHAMLRQLWAGGSAADADVLEVVTFQRTETAAPIDPQQRSFHVQRLKYEIAENDARERDFAERAASAPHNQTLQVSLRDIKANGEQLRETLANWQDKAA